MSALKNKKVIIPLALLILGLGAAYSMAKPHPVVKEKVKGEIYQLPKSFLLNLADGRYAKLTVALILAPGQSDGAAEGAAASSEESAGTLPEEALVREIVTNTLTGQNGATLISSSGRRDMQHQILAAISKQTDVKVETVLFPDLTVQ